MADTYIQKTRGLWDRWVHMKLRSPSVHEDDYFELWEWLQLLVQNDILPKLKQVGYTFDCSPNAFVECLLNHYFNVYYKQYYRDKWYTSEHPNDASPPKLHCDVCKHAIRKYKKSEFTYNKLDPNILLEYYEVYKMPDRFWQSLREKYEVDFIADNSYFARQFWLTLPHIVFGHIDHRESLVSQRIENIHPCMTEDDYGDHSATFIKASIQQSIEADPYYKDYYKQ